MDLKTIREEARKKLEGYCRVCPVCDGRACAGEVPGMGGIGTGRGFRANLEALDRYRLNLRTLHGAKDPDTTCRLFGLTLKTPVLAAPLTGTPYNMGGALSEREFIGAIISGSRAAGSLGFSGDGADPAMYDSGVAAVAAENGWGVPIVKPREQEAVLDRLRQAEAAGAVAAGMDIDGAGLVIMTMRGQPVGPKTPAELRRIISATRLPFIVKGVMTPDEARLAVDAGAKAIVVSNHGGRILDHTPGAADVLPDIVDRVKGQVTILADGGVRSGVDVLKLLALGADAVLVGRPVVIGAFGGGADGVRLILERLTVELRQAMLLTGCASLAGISRQVLYQVR